MSGELEPPLFQPPETTQFNPFSDSDDKDFIDAKAFLLQSSTVTGINVYDHLSNVLTKILEERPCNAVDVLEELSKLEKRNRFQMSGDGIIDKANLTTEIALAEIQRRLFSKRGGDTAQEGEEQEEEEEEEDDEEDDNLPLPDLMQLCYYFEQAGVGLNREEMVRVWLALKTLAKQHNFTSIRFWGKIFGIEQNYIIAEVQFEEGEEPEEEEEAEEEEEEEEESAKSKDDDEEGGEEEEEEDKLPQIVFKPPPVVPKEEIGTGVNKFTYYVCTEPGKPWVKLPSVTPQQITVARKIKKFFTGRLDAPIICYPPFEGREAHYLRAQIARISAGTQISPLGYFMFDEEEDEPEEGEIRETVMLNEEYEPLGVRELIDPGLENWVHHTLHILPQGRVKWWNPKEAAGEEEAEEAEDEEKEEPEELEPEVGPPLLTPLSEDAELNGMPAWTTRISSKLVKKFAVAVIHSCLWPGAHAFATEKTFENIYIGWGHKYSAENFTPALPPGLQAEYPSGPEITETRDPTAEEEAAYKAEHEEAGEEEEEEDDEDDDDAGDDDQDDED